MAPTKTMAEPGPHFLKPINLAKKKRLESLIEVLYIYMTTMPVAEWEGRPLNIGYLFALISDLALDFDRDSWKKLISL